MWKMHSVEIIESKNAKRNAIIGSCNRALNGNNQTDICASSDTDTDFIPIPNISTSEWFEEKKKRQKSEKRQL